MQKDIIAEKVKDGVIRVNGSPVIPIETKRIALIVGSAPCVWKDLDGKLKAASGFIKETYGAPTAEWISS